MLKWQKGHFLVHKRHFCRDFETKSAFCVPLDNDGDYIIVNFRNGQISLFPSSVFLSPPFFFSFFLFFFSFFPLSLVFTVKLAPALERRSRAQSFFKTLLDKVLDNF